MKTQTPHPKLIDEQVYRTTVLQLSYPQTEDEIDEQLQQEAHNLGLFAPQLSADVEGMTSSLSATTLGSDSNKQASLLSQSTAPTSCSSSENRAKTQAPSKSVTSGQAAHSPSTMTETQKKRSSGFRSGLRNKMAGLKRKKSPSTPTLRSIRTDSMYSPEGDRLSIKSGMKSPASAKSSKSSWSSPASVAKSSYESAPPIDQEAHKRSIESPEMLNLLKSQSEEKHRFSHYEQSIVAELQTQRDVIKGGRSQGHRDVLDERQAQVSSLPSSRPSFPPDEIQIEKAVEELEARQLEDELKMQKEHEAEKRTVMTRLRHMEAYCQNPTRPPTPLDLTSGRPSFDAVLPERKVTERDYHNLAQQYRERDAMDNLHAAKINVLRGKQKKAVENLLRKREKELEDLEHEQEKELAQVDKDFAAQEEKLRSALGAKRVRLELRWRTQTLIETTKMERSTGPKNTPLL